MPQVAANTVDPGALAGRRANYNKGVVATLAL